MSPATSLADAPPTARFHEKREAVLCAAAQCFNERGVRGATLADIAARVGLATNSVTYYYRRKEDLATACFLRALEAIDRLIDDALDERSAQARLARFFRRHAQMLAEVQAGAQPPLILFNDIRSLPPAQTEQVFAAYNQMFRRMRSLFDAPDAAALDRPDRNARTHLVISVAHAVRGWIDRYEPDEYPRVAARVADVLLHGMGAAGSAWPDPAPALPTLQPDEADGLLDPFLRAATTLVNEQGWRGASVDRISARLNLTKGSFYHHHEHKHDLIVACFERSFAVQRRALVAAADAPVAGWGRAIAAAVALLRFQLSAHGPLLRITAISALPDEVQRAQVRLTQQRLADRLAGVLVDGMVDGSIRPLDPAVAAQILSAVVNGAVELQRWVPTAQADNAAALYLRPAFEGVLCAPG